MNVIDIIKIPEMDPIDAIEILEELKDNAEELNEEKYKNAFEYAISAILDADMRLEFMEIIQEMLIKEFGEEWYNEFSEKVAKEKLRRDLKKMGDNDFTRFVNEHFDEITTSN